MDSLKVALTTEPVLALPTEKGRYYLDTDASNIAIAGIFHQEQEINGEKKLRVIAYNSKVLNSAQQNYSAAKLEMLALLTFVEKNACYLAGREFTVRVDCSSLVWLLNYGWENNALATRWIARLQGFQFDVVHRERAKNAAADALTKTTNLYKEIEGRDRLKTDHPFLEFLNKNAREDVKGLIQKLMHNAMISAGYVKQAKVPLSSSEEIDEKIVSRRPKVYGNPIIDPKPCSIRSV